MSDMNELTILHQYTPADMIEDGTLIDVTETAKKNGFVFPVSMTSTVWMGSIEPDEIANSRGATEECRLTDCLLMLNVSIKQATLRKTGE